MPPSIRVRELRLDETDAIAEALARAFTGETMMDYVLGDTPNADRGLVRLFADGLRMATATGAVYVPDGALVGAAMCWPLPQPSLSPEIAATLEPSEAVLGETGAARFAALLEHVDGHLAQVVPPPAWYLPALGVEPAAQGQGIGGALLRAFLDRAAADRLPACWATWSLANVAFYQHHGAQVVADGILPGPDLPYWLLRAG